MNGIDLALVRPRVVIKRRMHTMDGARRLHARLVDRAAEKIADAEAKRQRKMRRRAASC